MLLLRTLKYFIFSPWPVLLLFLNLCCFKTYLCASKVFLCMYVLWKKGGRDLFIVKCIPLGDRIYTVNAQHSPWYLHGAAYGNRVWFIWFGSWRKWKWKWIFIISRIVKDSQIGICNQHIIYIIFIWVLYLQEVQEPLQTLILLLLEDPSSSIIWWTADPVISQCLAGSGEQVLPRNLNSKKKKKKRNLNSTVI